MIGVIWNCRGVIKKGREISIRELITDHKADFIGLQETMKKVYRQNFRTIDPNRSYGWHWLPSKGRSRGIICGIKMERFDIIKITEHEFAVAAVVLDKKLNKK
jgi:hypothetical protein